MSQPPQYQTSIFNSSYFNSTNGALDISTADKRYVKIGSSAFPIVLGGNTLGSTEAGYLTSITPGTGANSKALVLNSSGSITSGITSLTMTSLTAINLTGTLQTATQANITSVGTLTNLTLDTANTGLFTPNIKFWFNSAWTNIDHSMYLGITQGSATAQKALVVNSTLDISGMRNIGCTGTATLSTVNATTLQINSTTVTATATKLNYCHITTLGTAQATGSSNNTLSFDAYGSTGAVTIKSNNQVGINLTSAAAIQAELHVGGCAGLISHITQLLMHLR
ncbi:unnamed protein product [Phytophthora lilii]|uniref:Unnamed protein product n=1 Tax=Phytophthora lilii TaxID=2077276 RepID=A0A9W6UA72_9STRA|nr:unnamed protein product [Phytophthora lilii]